MIRTATRAILLTFGMIALLIGGVMLASGAFRPVRFFIGHFLTDHGPEARAFLETGASTAIAQTEPFFAYITGTQHEFHWYTEQRQDGDFLHAWYNGRIDSFRLNDVDLHAWSPDGQLAITQTNQRQANLSIWSEGEARLILSTPSRIMGLSWMNDGGLWWIESDLTGTWKLMRWRDNTQEELYRGAQTLDLASFDYGWGSGCAFYVDIDNTRYFYHNHELYRVPAGAVYTLPMQVDDCEHFILNIVDPDNPKEVRLWNGESDFKAPFQVYARHGETEWLGLEPSHEHADQWMFIYQNNQGRRYFSVEREQLPNTFQPELVLWATPYSIWSVDRSILIWNMESGDAALYPPPSDRTEFLESIRTDYLAWIGVKDRLFTLYIWENQQLTQFVIPQNGLFRMLDSTLKVHWLTDNRLFIYASQHRDRGEYPRGTYIYQWTGQDLQLFSYVPAQGWLEGDWITWE